MLPQRDCLVNSSSWDRRRGSSKKEAPAATGASPTRSWGGAYATRFARAAGRNVSPRNILARMARRSALGAFLGGGEPPIGAAMFYRHFSTCRRLFLVRAFLRNKLCRSRVMIARLLSGYWGRRVHGSSGWPPPGPPGPTLPP